jgi:NitT/TauT family transport system substrate-binding protein
VVTSFLASVGRTKGVGSKMVGSAQFNYAGWHMMIPPNSKITKPEDLAGKNIAITSTGGGADVLALFTQANRKIQYTRVSVGGGGLVPSLTSGNVDAVVMPPPLSYNLIKSGEAKSLIDYTKEVPLHQAGGWVTNDKNIKERPEVIQKALNALYGGLAYLLANRDYALKLIAEIDDIPLEIAAQEFEATFKTLPTTPEVTVERVEKAFELNRLVGATGLIAPADVFTDQFFAKMVPTKP